MIAVIYRCGLRMSEVIALDGSHVDLDERTLFVARAAGRTIAMDADAYRLVERWIDRRKEARLESAAPLFCTLRGARLNPSYLRALLPRLARKAGIEKRVCAETLRRTLAVELSREGVSVQNIQGLLGHANPATTARYIGRSTSRRANGERLQRPSWRP